MSVKVHIVNDNNSEKFEQKIENFCEGKTIYNIKYQPVYSDSSKNVYHNAMIIYGEYKNLMKKDCSTCKYFDLNASDAPCMDCYDHSLWEG